MKKKITVSVISDLATDQRVMKICTALQQMGFEVEVIARRLKNSLPLEPLPFAARRLRCYFTKGISQYAEFNVKLFFAILFKKTDYFLANDLDVLGPNYVVSKLRGKHLFYDTHEYFTGVPELRHSPLKRKVWKKLEDWIFPRLKTVYTVNDSVRREYEQEYGVPLKVIRNIPPASQVQPAPLPERWQGKLILLAQGAGLNHGRSCIELIEALPLLDDRFIAVFIGSGTYWEELKKRRTELGLEQRFEMMDKMLPSKLKTITPLAFLGFSLDNFEDKNCLYNLPNKVFDYMHAGVPMIATAIPEIKKIVEQYGNGICITDTSPRAIAGLILQLAANPRQYEQLKQGTAAAALDLCWEKEVEVLKEIYKNYL